MTHYYTDNAALSSDRKEFGYYFGDEFFKFTTDNGVFSKGSVDYGSYLLIKNVYKRSLGKTILDLGCGWGPVGIIMKRFHPDIDVVMVDVNSRAVELSSLNCAVNSTDNTVCLCEDILSLNYMFDSIILNPPIRAGKSVIYGLYEKSYLKLNDGGSLFIVIQKKQGAESSQKKLKELFKEVELLDRDGGYHIYRAVK